MTLIGNYSLECDTFFDIETLISALKKKKMGERTSFACRQILTRIEKSPQEAFLLKAVIEAIAAVNPHLSEPITFSFFEFYLNQKSGLSTEKNLEIRAKIAGKKIPRGDYQILFPIGMGNTFAGSHFVSAHKSPDTDTTVASFWGWIDSFAAKVGEGLHHWSLPGGAPSTSITELFKKIFGDHFFDQLIRSRATLTLAALDLINDEGVELLQADQSIRRLDHGTHEKALLLIDSEGKYLGSWRASDVERVEQIIRLVEGSIDWMASRLRLVAIDTLSKKSPSKKSLEKQFAAIDQQRVDKIFSFSENDRSQLLQFFENILQIKAPVTFEKLQEKLSPLKEFRTLIETGVKKILSKSRQQIFQELKSLSIEGNKLLLECRKRIERLDLALLIKEKILHIPQNTLLVNSDIEEIRTKMGSFSHLPCIFEGRPLGVVWAKEVRLDHLGTVSFRDFCNEEEVQMASYLTPISVIDHHKSNLKTASPPAVLIGDAQSANVLLAELAMTINDRYSTLGMSRKQIKEQLKKNPSGFLQQRLLQKEMALQLRGNFFIHPKREFAEYFFFLQAILDDTDLLSKVTLRDVRCVMELVNRMKGLVAQQETEVIQIKSAADARKAADEILQHEELYSIYSSMYNWREQQMEKSLQNLSDDLFDDTKEQNGCCRVGQIKLFCSNRSLLEKKKENLLAAWIEKSLAMTKNHPSFDLHIMMISTIPSAKEVYRKKKRLWRHEDEYWIWIPSSEIARDHLAFFLNAFGMQHEVSQLEFEVEFKGNECDWLEEIFTRNFISATFTKDKNWSGECVALLKFTAGALNSRKALVSPFLPKIVS